jgi:hypothetical protein
VWELVNLVFLLVILYVFVKLFLRHVFGIGGGARRGGGGGHFAGELALMGMRVAGAVFVWFMRSVAGPLARMLGRAGSRVLERSAARVSVRAVEQQRRPRSERVEPSDE